MPTLEQLDGLCIFQVPQNLVVKSDQVCAEKEPKVKVNNIRFQTEKSRSTVWPPRTTPVVGLTPDTGENCTERYSSQFENNCFTEMRSGSEEGSYSRLIDGCITQL